MLSEPRGWSWVQQDLCGVGVGPTPRFPERVRAPPCGRVRNYLPSVSRVCVQQALNKDAQGSDACIYCESRVSGNPLSPSSLHW